MSDKKELPPLTAEAFDAMLEQSAPFDQLRMAALTLEADNMSLQNRVAILEETLNSPRPV